MSEFDAKKTARYAELAKVYGPGPLPLLERMDSLHEWAIAMEKELAALKAATCVCEENSAALVALLQERTALRRAASALADLLNRPSGAAEAEARAALAALPP